MKFMNMQQKPMKSEATGGIFLQVEEGTNSKTNRTVPAQLRRQLCPNPAITDSYKKEHLQCAVSDLFGKTASNKFAFSQRLAQRDHREILKYRQALHTVHGQDFAQKILDRRKISEDPRKKMLQFTEKELQHEGHSLLPHPVQSGHSSKPAFI